MTSGSNRTSVMTPEPGAKASAAACGRASWSTSDGDHQGEQAADDSSGQEPQTNGDDQRKDVCLQIGADTLSKGVCEHMSVCVRMSVCVARARDALRMGAVVLQRQQEAEKTPSHSAATKHEVTQAPAQRSALSRAQSH